MLYLIYKRSIYLLFIGSRIGNLDNFLGRAGHVKFLSDVQFIREFCACFDKFFA